jgi:hypothetical protein
MKPSNIFHDDNSSSSKYWSKSSIIRWNKECIDEAKSFLSLKMLAQLVIITFTFVGIGFFLISWLYPYSSPTTNQQNTPDRDNLIIVNFNKNLSITNSSLTEEASTQINRLQKIAFEASTTHQPSTDVISHDDEYAEDEPRNDDDALLLTKKYVRLNFDSFSIRVRFGRQKELKKTLTCVGREVET